MRGLSCVTVLCYKASKYTDVFPCPGVAQAWRMLCMRAGAGSGPTLETRDEGIPCMGMD